MDFEITDKEFEIINSYKNNKYSSINQFLSPDVEMDISLVMSGEKIDYKEDTVISNIELIKRIFAIIIKNAKKADKNWNSYRVVNIAEINRLRTETKINRFLIASENADTVTNDSLIYNSIYGVMQICGNSEIPFVKFDKEDDEIIIPPFLEVEKIEEIKEDSLNGLKIYKVFLKNQNLLKLTDTEENELYKRIINNSNNVNQKLNECLKLEEENTTNFENIRKLEQLLSTHNIAMEQEGYDRDNNDKQKQDDLDNISRINNELTSLKSIAIDLFDKKKENILFISEWKKDVIKYMMSEIQKIKDIGMLNSNKEDDEKDNSTLQKDNQIDNNKEMIDNVEEKEVAEIKELDPEVESVKKECQENIVMVDTLLENIKNLIYKQQNHARIAELLNSNYKALNNAFEMKNNAEELDALVKGIANKVQNYTKDNTEELHKVSKTNMQVSTLLNYLNNPKSAVSKRISRFEELSILEENELKRCIAETIKNIRCEAELKKLKDDIDIINDRSGLKKFIGKFTGSNKLNETKIEQIEICQTAIRKTFKMKMPLAHNYSIHNMIAEIEMFIQDNEDDELVAEDVSNLRNIRDNLKKNFVIINSRVVSIIDQKTGKYLPVDSRKLSKKELIEIKTYRFLNKYGYNRPVQGEEPMYQDTLANEIKRIVDYIKTSEICIF